MKKVVLLFLVFGFVLNLMAQYKINLDTFDHDQLNLYKGKAVKLKTTGEILLGGGAGVFLTGYFVARNIAKNSNEDFWTVLNNASAALVLGGLIGISSAVTGISLIITGNNRISKAEIALKKFDLKPDNSMAIGLRLTFRF
jgi:hypothetical protein